ANQLEQTHLRDHEALPSARYHQPWNDRERERNFELHSRALARAAEYVHRAADSFDVALHHIHPYAPSRYVGERLRRRQAGMEKQANPLAFAQSRGLLGLDHSPPDSSLLDALYVDARSVIRDLDIDLPAFVVRAQRQFSLWRFTGPCPRLRQLDAVIA